jgi:hypothetical protein
MPTPALKPHSIRQVSAAGKFSGAKWLVFLHSVSQLSHLNVPFDCELLVAQWEGEVARLSEAYRVGPDKSLQVQNFGDWSVDSYNNWPRIGLYRRRKSLDGHVIRTVVLEDVSSYKNPNITFLFFSNLLR